MVARKKRSTKVESLPDAHLVEVHKLVKQAEELRYSLPKYIQRMSAIYKYTGDINRLIGKIGKTNVEFVNNYFETEIKTHIGK